MKESTQEYLLLRKMILLNNLREVAILKDNLGFEFQNLHYNKPAHKIEHEMQKILEEKVDNILHETGVSLKPKKIFQDTIKDTLDNQKKTLLKDPDRFSENAVKQNTDFYNDILLNRIDLEAAKFDTKIWKELSTKKYNSMSLEQTRKELLKNLKGVGTARPKNIIRDALHTNQSSLSFIRALDDGYRYKTWRNGRLISAGGVVKGRTRPWHVASKIAPVLIEDVFDIYGSYHAQSMYPGDPMSGAENVANCKCWLMYGNERPNGFKRKGTYNIDYHNVFNKKNNKPTKTNSKKDSKTPSKTGRTSTLKNIKNTVWSKVKSLFNKIKGGD